jgi:hypothetical protein
MARSFRVLASAALVTCLVANADFAAAQVMPPRLILQINVDGLGETFKVQIGFDPMVNLRVLAA